MYIADCFNELSDTRRVPGEIRDLGRLLDDEREAVDEVKGQESTLGEGGRKVGQR